MKLMNSKKALNKIILDIAEAVSENPNIAKEYLDSHEIELDDLISKGMSQFAKKAPNESIKLSKSQSYFKRVVLAAEIANQCHLEPTFGNVKFQKLVYLCEQVSNMELTTHYSKQAAGPFDNRFMHSIGKEFEKQKWFEVKKIQEGKYSKVKFTPLENINNYKPYYQRYFESANEDMQYIIETFKKSYTKNVELVATIFACWSELKSLDKPIDNDSLISSVYNWHTAKKKFKPEEIVKTISWMKANKISPL